MVFDFEDHEPDEYPDGDTAHIFKRFGESTYEIYHADTLREAWDGIRLDYDDEWKHWMCIGTGNTVAYNIEELDEEPENVVYGVPGAHPVQFAALYPNTAQEWEDV